MTEQYLPNTFANMAAAYGMGQDQRKAREATQQQNQLRQLSSGVFAGDAAATQQAYALDPDTAEKYTKGADRIGIQVNNIAKQIKQFSDAKRPELAQQLYQQALPTLKQRFPNAPDQFGPDVMTAVEAVIAQTNQLGTASNVQSTYVDAQGNRVGIMRDGTTQVLGQNAPNNQIIDTGAGFVGVNKGNLSAKPVMLDKQPPQPPSQQPAQGAAGPVMQDAYQGSLDPQAIQTDFRNLAEQFPGTQISSMDRTPEHNRQVGGVANSQHMRGTAGDFVVPADQRAAFIAQAQARGFEAINEGDHVHLELPPAARQSSGNPPPPLDYNNGGQQLRSAPKPMAQPTQLQLNADARDEERLRLAQTASQLAQDKANEAPKLTAAAQKDMMTRKAKQPQVANLSRGMARIESALNALSKGGLSDTGPVDQYAQRYTQAGKELEAAIGGIQNSLLSLTRVPGIGSQSDLEARIASLQYPSLDQYPENNKRTLENLKAFTQDLQDAYRIAGDEDSGAAPARTTPASGGWSIQAVP